MYDVHKQDTWLSDLCMHLNSNKLRIKKRIRKMGRLIIQHHVKNPSLVYIILNILQSNKRRYFMYSNFDLFMNCM